MNTPAPLTKDQRGAILVMGAAMLLPLIAMVWYVIGVGDAITHRERLQDGADAMAFLAAVDHARGMNLIVTLNLMMAAILAVLVALKLVQLINTVAQVITCALSFLVPGFQAACAFTSSLQGTISSQIPPVQTMVDTAIPPISLAQRGIAESVPFLAEAHTMAVAQTDYKAPADEDHVGAMFSISLVPHVPVQRYALPVEEDTFEKLCEEAGRAVGQVAFKPFGPVAGVVSGLTAALVGAFPAYFCGDTGAESLSDTTGKQFKDAATKQCEEKQKAAAAAGTGSSSGTSGGTANSKGTASKKSSTTGTNAGATGSTSGSGTNAGSSSGSGNGQEAFDMEACIEKATDELNDKFNKTGQVPQAAGRGQRNKTPKRVFGPAANGNGFFQIWSFLGNRNTVLERDVKGVSVAAGAQQPSTSNDGRNNLAIAQSEYFYDTDDTWANARTGAMWSMRWKARLVRVRPVEAVFSGIGGGLASVTNGLVEKYVFGPVGSAHPFLGFLLKVPEVESNVQNRIGDLVNRGANLGMNTAASRLMQDPTRSVIH